MLDQNHLCFMFVPGLAEDTSRGRGMLQKDVCKDVTGVSERRLELTKINCQHAFNSKVISEYSANFGSLDEPRLSRPTKLN